MKIKKKQREQLEFNTTALPDIIFMLLFFFMVTTVMQKPSDKKVILPKAFTEKATERTNPKELSINLIALEDGEQKLFVNQFEGGFERADVLLAKAVSQMKEDQFLPEKAVLRIDANIKMSTVNELKTSIQKHNIQKVEYIHRKE